MNFFRKNDVICCSQQATDAPSMSEAEALQGEGSIFYLFEEAPRHNRAAFVVTHPAQLGNVPADLSMLSATVMGAASTPCSSEMAEAISRRRVVAVNRGWPGWEERLSPAIAPKKQRVHLLGLGNVGANCLLSMVLLGGDVISDIGIYDRDEAQMARWQLEMNQIAGPAGRGDFPHVSGLQTETLFDCDVFIFAASRGVPEPGKETGDVRVLQYEQNKRILAEYARLARSVSYQGRFIVLSDPVEMLCFAAYDLSNRDAAGHWDGLGLLPDQIEGFGLGVMHGRALFEAKRNPQFSAYAQTGRAYGRHGQGLVLAIDPVKDNTAASVALTDRVEHANLDVRALGFKPYVAPAVASGTLSLLALLRGDWKYSSVFMGGIYFGVRNRSVLGVTEVEALPLDETLWQRIQEGAASLKAWAEEEGTDHVV